MKKAPDKFIIGDVIECYTYFSISKTYYAYTNSEKTNDKEKKYLTIISIEIFTFLTLELGLVLFSAPQFETL